MSMNSTVKKVQFSDEIDVCYFESGLPYTQLLAMRDKTARKFGYISEEDADNMQIRKNFKIVDILSCNMVEDVYHELLTGWDKPAKPEPGYGTDCDEDDLACASDSSDDEIDN